MSTRTAFTATWISFYTEAAETKLKRELCLVPEGTCPFRFPVRGLKKRPLSFPNEGPCSKFAQPLPDAQLLPVAGNAATYPSKTSASVTCGLILAYCRLLGLTLDAHLPTTMRCRCLKDIGFGIIWVRANWSPVISVSEADAQPGEAGQSFLPTAHQLLVTTYREDEKDSLEWTERLACFSSRLCCRELPEAQKSIYSPRNLKHSPKRLSQDL